MVPRTVPDIIETDLTDFRAALRQTRLAVLDFETSDVRPRIAVVAGLGAYLPEQHRVFYINAGHSIRDANVPLYEPVQVARVLQPFLRRRSSRVVMHNASYDLRMLFRMGIDVRCQAIDTLILSHRLDENLRSNNKEPTFRDFVDHLGYGLKQLTTVYFNVKPPTLHDTIGTKNTLSAPPVDVARYCAQDVVNTFNLYERAVNRIAADPALTHLTDTIDNPNNLVVAKMMWEGYQIDADEARRQQHFYLAAIQRCREMIWQTLGIDWGLDKPKDLLRVLRYLDFKEDLGFDPFRNPWISTDPRDPGGDDDRVSVTMELLQELQDSCDDERKKLVVALIRSKWSMQQRLSAFVKPLPQLVMYTDGRLYLDRFASTLVTTRFSSSPNLQNLPKRADAATRDEALPEGCSESHKTRNLFVAKPGYVLVSLDLSAAEPRYLAMLFQKALKEKDVEYHKEIADLRAKRFAKYPDLMTRMMATHRGYAPQPCPQCGTALHAVPSAGRMRQQCPKCQSFPLEIQWPAYKKDPLWEVFKKGGDPYNALLTALDPDGFAAAQAAGQDDKWLEDNRWRGKRGFLALAYGSQAGTLAPQLEWTLEQTEQALTNLLAVYATLKPLQELTLLRMIHLGSVRNLWGRPRRINGYSQLAGTEPLTVQFYRLKPNPRTYEADIIPLGSTRQGVQAFVRKCWVLRHDGRRMLVMEGNPDGTLKYIDNGEPICRADHFNTPPFRNLNFSQINWVQDEYGLKRCLPEQKRGLRQAFNSLCQGTGADHLRWLMNRVDDRLRLAKMQDCKLILTVHDSLVYEVPEASRDRFVALVLPVVRKRPPWATIPIKVDVEYGVKFGEMTKMKGI